jgi:hypothetical protein
MRKWRNAKAIPIVEAPAPVLFQGQIPAAVSDEIDYVSIFVFLNE